jgi:hypothetical protein
MRLLRFLLSESRFALMIVFILLGFHITAAGAKELPSDVCSLLGAQQLQKTMGQPLGPATKTSAPAAYSGQPEGTRCQYPDKGGAHGVMLIVYADRSPAEAKQTFDKLSMWFPAKSKPTGIGDAAYIDKEGAVHVLKGNVRFFISASTDAPEATREKQVQELATAVVAQL